MCRSLAVLTCIVALLPGCTTSSKPSSEEGEWSAERQTLAKKLADVGITKAYVRKCLIRDQAIAVVTIGRVQDHGGGLHTDVIRQCHFRAVEVIRPGADEQGGSIWDYPWFALVPRPGQEREPITEGMTILVVLNFNVSRWPESERVVIVEGAEDPRVGELQRMVDEENTKAVKTKEPWER